MLQSPSRRADARQIRLHSVAPPIDLPKGYVGPAWLPGTGRMIWWTGRVAIGLRHEPRPEPALQSTAWVQDVMLAENG
jgi:hypothetical protein